MRFFIIVVAALSVAVPQVLGSPASTKVVQTFVGEKTGRLIVKLKDGAPKANIINNLGAPITHEWDIVNGFAGNFNGNAINTLLASPDVESVSEDGIMHTMVNVTQNNAPWGLSRLSSPKKLSDINYNLLDYTYTYDSSAGSGVDIYVVDTGVLTTHTQFGGRASWGATFGGYDSADGNGHGTHCAGTAAGIQYGVAKNASIIAVKVLADSGSGSVTDIISGLDWVLTQVNNTNRPSIVSMSLGGSATPSLDDAVSTLTQAGIHVTVAAGNSDADASGTSPARAPSANTVGASTIVDERATFSNYGAVVDVFAPGQYIISSWIGSNTATNMISGTSMATPHVAGLIAYLIARDGNLSPDDMSNKVKSLSTKGVLTGLPSGTPNNLAHNS